MLGTYPTPVNWHYTATEARYLFENSGAKAIIIHADLIPAIEAALPAGVPVLVVATPPEIAEAYGIEAGAVPPGMTDWSTWLEQFAPLDQPVTEAPGSIIYTSGTTGHPKGVRRNQPTPEQAAQRHDDGALCHGLCRMARAGPTQIVTVVTGPMYHSAPNAYGLYRRADRRQGDPRAALRTRRTAGTDRARQGHATSTWCRSCSTGC